MLWISVFFSIRRPGFIDGFFIKSKAKWTRPIPAKSYSSILCTTSTSCLANPDGWTLHPVTNQLVWFRCCMEWDIHKLTCYDLWYWYWLVSRIQRPLTATLRGFLRVEMRCQASKARSDSRSDTLVRESAWDAAPWVKSSQISRDVIIQCYADS